MNYHRLVQSVIFVAVALASSLVIASDPKIDAMTLVKKARLGDNLPSLGYQYAQRTTTYQIIVKSVGAEKAQLLVQSEIDNARPKYQEQWDKNLAASYVETFAPNEFRPQNY